ncbi:MAG: STAS domain-containing protein [Planctomycetes bacterium]|nr:STAS domain-containing protein [Planctomycetota bacterium]
MELRVLADDDVLRLEAIGPIRGVELTLESEATKQIMGGKTIPPMVLLSLEKGRFIDSNGLAWLVAVNRRFGKMDGKLVLHSIPASILDLLKMMRLDQVLNLADDEPAAIRAIRGESP